MEGPRKETESQTPFDREARDAERQSAFKPDLSVRVGVKAPAAKMPEGRPEFKFRQADPHREALAFDPGCKAVDYRAPNVPPLPSTAPTEIRGDRNTGFHGGTEIKISGVVMQPIGKICEVRSATSPIKVPRLPEKMRLMGSEVTQKSKEPTLPPPSRVPPVQMPLPSKVQPVLQPLHPPFEEPKPGISIERMVFLERVERIMASEARIKEIEAENKTLVGMVSRLNKELDELKAKLAARS